jgi:hypothetical protein
MKLSFKTESEGWNIYHLADGTEVKVRVLLVSVARKDGQFDPQGNPLYDLNMQTVVNIDAPEQLKLQQVQSGTPANLQ